jgi:hypothetical protein
VVAVQAKRLTLEQRRGTLISRERAVAQAFGFARTLRDRCLAWPARVGPLLAAEFDLDAPAVTVVLEGYVREHLEELASERGHVGVIEFLPGGAAGDCGSRGRPANLAGALHPA